jgi:hypothetical protein
MNQDLWICSQEIWPASSLKEWQISIWLLRSLVKKLVPYSVPAYLLGNLHSLRSILSLDQLLIFVTFLFILPVFFSFRCYSVTFLLLIFYLCLKYMDQRCDRIWAQSEEILTQRPIISFALILSRTNRVHSTRLLRCFFAHQIKDNLAHDTDANITDTLGLAHRLAYISYKWHSQISLKIAPNSLHLVSNRI